MSGLASRRPLLRQGTPRWETGPTILRAVTFTDWAVTLVGLPLGIVIGWWASWRVWRHRGDVSAGVTWAAGDAASAGYNAAILPGALMLTCMWVFVVCEQIWVGLGQRPDWLSTVSTVFAALGIFFMLLAFWLWAFMWPRFMVPPHLRGARGWFPTLWHEWREHRRDVRSRPRIAGGKRRRQH
jgi:hypothetical protein